MLRFRRYRIFLIFAAIFTIILIRLTHQTDWTTNSQIQNFDVASTLHDNDHGSAHEKQPSQPPPPLHEKPKENAKPQSSQNPVSPSRASIAATTTAVTSFADVPLAPTSSAVLEFVPTIIKPDRQKLPLSNGLYSNEHGLKPDFHPIGGPGKYDQPIFSEDEPPVFWEKQTEHFPVSTDSIIQLPTGKPVSIPKIQHFFRDETVDAKITREKRQSMVKEEFRKAWAGYKKNAWLHDELSPVSGNFRDPFCGWAATLVDALDTLWIMGFQDEFEEAVRAVDLIDFSTSPRGDIPVFETTIRYLGGLLAAYDVSEGKYKNLLNKAVELAEILMGAFDTPNRMPVLFYRWKPAFASQAHRASQRSNLAELGSLSMEFTRLAQLTKEPRYYDAVARITNALSEWQDRGTKLGGVFPENVDTSGCNYSALTITMPPRFSEGRGPAANAARPAEEPFGYQPNNIEPPLEPKTGAKVVSTGAGSLEMQSIPGPPEKAKIQSLQNDLQEQAQKLPPTKRSLSDEGIKVSNRTLHSSNTDTLTRAPLDGSQKLVEVGHEPDCMPQGLDSSAFGMNKFSMAGGQDSTYEYFPKQFLLLGGLEDKYRKMYLKTIDDVRKWMLYRPMAPGNPDILFSGSVLTYGDPKNDIMLNAEVEHLTCFIGGMVGLGARTFGLEGDLEIAKKLADGCVWAYSAFPSGIMPESSTVMPCKNAENCTWNETAYHDFLDPPTNRRDDILQEYLEKKELQDAEYEAALASAAALAGPSSVTEDGTELVSGNNIATTYTPRASGLATVPIAEESSMTDGRSSLRKRQKLPKDDLRGPDTHNSRHDAVGNEPETEFTQLSPAGLTGPSANIEPTPMEKIYEHKSKLMEEDFRNSAAGRQAEVPFSRTDPFASETIPDPMRPLSHKEWITAQIKQEGLPPGFVTIRGKKYILRPEAIESVWYLYRITGDPSWQEKGWKMFEAIIRATSTVYGHSALHDVTVEQPIKVDEMESFWLAETLKYFYLLYSTPDTISLDDWVLNTEAHPFKRPSQD